LLQYLSSHSKRIYIINIAPGIEAVYQHSPGIEKNIIMYNEIISKIISSKNGIRLIDVYSEFKSDHERYMTEDLHITKQAHQWIYQQIVKFEESIKYTTG
jgi:hypothetical protein